MVDKVIEVQLWETKCPFCGQKFAGAHKGKLRQAYCDHIDTSCKVLKCVCIIKDIEYPLKREETKH